MQLITFELLWKYKLIINWIPVSETSYCPQHNLYLFKSSSYLECYSEDKGIKYFTDTNRNDRLYFLHNKRTGKSKLLRLHEHLTLLLLRNISFVSFEKNLFTKCHIIFTCV